MSNRLKYLDVQTHMQRHVASVLISAGYCQKTDDFEKYMTFTRGRDYT